MQSDASAGHSVDTAASAERGGLQRRSPQRPFSLESISESPLRSSGEGLAFRRTSPNRIAGNVNTAANFQNLSSAQTCPTKAPDASKNTSSGSPLRRRQDVRPMRWSDRLKNAWRRLCGDYASHDRYTSKHVSSMMTWVESALLLSGGACILLFLFLTVVEVDLSFGEDALERDLDAFSNEPPLRTNTSAYQHDPFIMHWGGKACEKTPLVLGDTPPGGRGVLPTVVVIGVHKGGSSALFSYLAAHGDVRPSFCKEAHFFDWKYNAMKRRQALATDAPNSKQDIQQLRKVYATFFRARQPDNAPFYSIEGTPEYFFSREIPHRMHEIVPDAHIVVALRNPVERTISHFMGKAKTDFKGFPTCTAWFNHHAALVAKCDALRQRLPPVTWPVSHDAMSAWTAYAACMMDGANPVAKSIYAPQLFTWLQYFSPSRFHVVQSDRLFAFPQEEVRALTDAFGWRPHYQHESSTFGVVGSDHMHKFNARLLQPNVGQKQASFNKLFDCDVGTMQQFFYKYEQDVWDILQAAYPAQQQYFTKWSVLDAGGPKASQLLLRRGQQ
eukprot:m.235459 g.235459  ORF g.235459 m.235459 type:complete len:556 (-) comp19338_c0_seq1:88-1755(-)